MEAPVWGLPYQKYCGYDGRNNHRALDQRESGPEFTVDVELGITEEEMRRRKRKKENPNFSALKTLVVDDDVTVCESAMVTLKEIGIIAEWVDSGQKAIGRVQELCGLGRYFDMILIDWKMPEMDGIETARHQGHGGTGGHYHHYDRL